MMIFTLLKFSRKSTAIFITEKTKVDQNKKGMPNIMNIPYYYWDNFLIISPLNETHQIGHFEENQHFFESLCT